MSHLNLDTIYKFCKLLNIGIIKKEFDKKIKDYTLKEVKYGRGEFCSTFYRNEEDRILLTTSFDNIHLSEYTESYVESTTINANLLMTSVSIEKRENGIIYSILRKQFGLCSDFRNEIVLISLKEERYTFTKEKLEMLFKNYNFNTTILMAYLLKFKMIERRVNLKDQSDNYNEFFTYISNKTRTFLNGKNISSIYGKIDGKDKLYRIYDLYKKLTNSRSKRKLNTLSLRQLNLFALDLMSLEKITEKEDFLIGKPFQKDFIDEEDEEHAIREKQQVTEIDKSLITSPKRILKKLFKPHRKEDIK